MEKRVLIVEDSQSMASLERRYLEKEGFTVETVASGEECLLHIIGQGEPDLLIIDYRLPDMSGVELMQKLKEKGINRPSVIVTAAGNEKVAVDAMKLGAMDYIVKDVETIKRLPETCNEVLAKFNLQEENARLVEKLKLVNTDLVEANRRLEELSKKDDLTGIYNRRYLMESLGYEVARSRRYRTPLCFAIFDLDHFKDVNDTYGHITGDLVLKQFASLINSRLRKTDIHGRYGGEEFGIVLTDTKLENAYYLFDEIREIVARYSFGYEHSPIKLTTSAGVGALEDSMDIGMLIEIADKSLYIAKQKGRNLTISVQMEQGEPL